jgi:hypothetical protein
VTLGADRTVCLNELKAALRPVAGNAVDGPPADANIAALAQALYAILTNEATVSVAQADNAAFWTWLTAVGAGSGAGPPPVNSLTGKVT